MANCNEVVVEGVGDGGRVCVGGVVVVDCCEGWLWWFFSRCVVFEYLPLFFLVVFVLFELFGDVLFK